MDDPRRTQSGHLVGIHEEGWVLSKDGAMDSVRWSVWMVRILTEAEKEGQLNSGIENWGIREFWNWGIANWVILNSSIPESQHSRIQNPQFQHSRIPVREFLLTGSENILYWK